MATTLVHGFRLLYFVHSYFCTSTNDERGDSEMFTTVFWWFLGGTYRSELLYSVSFISHLLFPASFSFDHRQCAQPAGRPEHHLNSTWSLFLPTIASCPSRIRVLVVFWFSKMGLQFIVRFASIANQTLDQKHFSNLLSVTRTTPSKWKSFLLNCWLIFVIHDYRIRLIKSILLFANTRLYFKIEIDNIIITGRVCVLLYVCGLCAISHWCRCHQNVSIEKTTT